jgi:hypothetical protein
MYNADKKLTCIQKIDPDPKPGEKEKKFEYGCQAKGCYYPIGKPTDSTLVIVEGWATGKSIHLATGLAVAVAFSSGNLPNVARLMRENHPDFEIVLAPDNDENRHAIEIAESAARQHHCQVVMPQFPEGSTGTDFDDLRQAESLEEVARQVMGCRYRPIFEAVTKTETVIEWPDYPLEALGPVLSEAAQAIANTVQTPLHLAGQSVLAATALAVQARANVQIDNRVHPLSLFCLTIGESGERKSGADYLALKPHREWERQQHKDANEEFETYRNELDTWKRDRQEALKKGGRGLDGFKPEPAKPLQPVFICEEPTLEGLQKSFRFGLPSQGLYSDEGGQFFGGHAMSADNALKTMAGLSKLWDGAPIKRTRAANGESWAGYHRRLSCHLLTQPIVAGTVLNDPLMQQQGILARFLITSGNHLFGKRPYRKPCPNDLAAIGRYQAAISKLLAEPWDIDEDGALELITVYPTNEAMALWVQAYNLIEAETADTGDYETIRAAASKSAENIARMAGIMAMFAGQSEITADTMENAIALGDYYLEQYLRHTHTGHQFAIQDQTKRLLDWLKSQGRGDVDIDTISKNAPTETGVRGSVNRVRTAMQRLVDSDAARIATVNNRHLPSAWKLL